jgi:hypothetical protein
LLLLAQVITKHYPPNTAYLDLVDD